MWQLPSEIPNSRFYFCFSIAISYVAPIKSLTYFSYTNLYNEHVIYGTTIRFIYFCECHVNINQYG